MTWQPIETAPKDGQYVLVFDPESRRSRVCQWDREFEYGRSGYIGAWTDRPVLSFGCEECKSYQPTHWMPLPEPPA